MLYNETILRGSASATPIIGSSSLKNSRSCFDRLKSAHPVWEILNRIRLKPDQIQTGSFIGSKSAKPDQTQTGSELEIGSKSAHPVWIKLNRIKLNRISAKPDQTKPDQRQTGSNQTGSALQR